MNMGPGFMRTGNYSALHDTALPPSYMPLRPVLKRMASCYLLNIVFHLLLLPIPVKRKVSNSLVKLAKMMPPCTIAIRTIKVEVLVH